MPDGGPARAVSAEIGQTETTGMRGQDARRGAWIASRGSETAAQDQRMVVAPVIDRDVDAVESGAAVLGDAEKFDAVRLPGKSAAGILRHRGGRAQDAA